MLYMHRRRSRKKELAHRIAIYALMTATMLSLLVLLTYRILGYQFNFSTRAVERSGLVQFDSFPRGARTQIDGRKYDLTQTKNKVSPGERQFSMSLEGYQDWQKTLTIKAGAVTWLNYARLVPSEKKITSVEELGLLANAKSSPDSRYMFGVRSTEAGFESVLVDLRNSRQPKTTTHPLELSNISGFEEEQEVSHQFSAIKWDLASRNVLVEHRYQGTVSGVEWLWIDRDNPAVATNISTLTNLSIQEIQPAKDGEVYILQDNGDVRRLTIETGTVSRPFISNVVSYGIYDANTIYYVASQADGQRIAGVWQDNWDVPTIIQTIPEDSEPVSVSASRYFYQDTIVLAHGSSVTIYRGTLPSNIQERVELIAKPFDKFTLSRPVTSLQISKNGRFIIAEDERGFVSYDLELSLISQQVRKYRDEAVDWLDQYHVWQVNESGVLTMQEFDGVNSYELLPANATYDAVLTQDGKSLYVCTKDETGLATLWRLAMTVEKN